MAYYAAAISLKLTLNRLLNSSHIWLLPPCLEIVEFAYEKVTSFEQVLQKLEQQLLKNSNNEEVNALMGQIRDAACKLEDSLESRVSDKYFSESESNGVGRVLILTPDCVKGVKQGINYIKEKMEKLQQTIQKISKELNPLDEEDDDASSSSQFGGEETKLVGVFHLFKEIKNLLTKKDPIPFGPICSVSIVGMAGIGKTTLVKEIYKDQLDFSHFECCAWVTIGPESYLKKALVQDKLHMEGERIFAEDLCTRLEGRKYLIVVDDIWSKQDWNLLNSLLPKENNGSWVLLTIRLEKVANYAGTYYKHRQVRFLGEEKSWDLLRQKVFGEKCLCPFQLEKVGRKLPRNVKVSLLPLSLLPTFYPNPRKH